MDIYNSQFEASLDSLHGFASGLGFSVYFLIVLSSLYILNLDYQSIFVSQD